LRLLVCYNLQVIDISDEQFDHLINEALASLPGEHTKRIENIAILREDDPTPEQRYKLQLRHDQSLYGLYEGVPLPQRQGQDRLYPDKITLFKHPLTSGAVTLDQVREQIRHTLWHEIGHYYGLDHKRIYELEQ
jgi:predicted Zn-dependent protease with MMP-like domain